MIGVSNVRLQRERDRAEARRLEAVANLRKAREAVDRMLTRVSEVQLKELPQVEPVQRALLEDAQEFYRNFVRQAHDDPEVLLEASQAYRRLGERYATLHWSTRPTTFARPLTCGMSWPSGSRLSWITRSAQPPAATTWRADGG